MIYMPIQVAIMHIRAKSKRGSTTYEQILLRESYRQPGAKRSAVKKRTLLNLTKYPAQIATALELALKHQGDLSALTATSDIALAQGPAVGAVFTLLEVARRLGIEKALGTHQNGKLALWQVIARATATARGFPPCGWPKQRRLPMSSISLRDFAKTASTRTSSSFAKIRRRLKSACLPFVAAKTNPSFFCTM
jgi:hypothetical protein